ncbi:hypothetical protein DYB38_008033 [Aphanomyces astaci]|uniref:Uncharacterized protein n=1 Tax=Aphanomyces astaci TaxID=112090 RepID=A0A397DT25_APHAT|nr:hypothetical protein DYB38_008033 [Aphanomyces astaci]
MSQRPFLSTEDEVTYWASFNVTTWLTQYQNSKQHGNPTDPVYSILGWAYLLDWVEGSREVVSFAGDIATLRLISYPYDVASSVDSTVLNSNALPRSIATLFGFGVWYVSWMFGIAEFCMVGVAAFYSFQISGHNMLFFHRVAGPIWIWWPFLFLCGLTAVILLSSSSPDLVQQHGLSTLVNRPHTFLSSLIFFEQLHRRSPTSEWWMGAASNVMCGMILITGFTTYLTSSRGICCVYHPHYSRNEGPYRRSSRRFFRKHLRGSSPVMRPPTLTAPCTVADPPTVAPTSWWSSLLLVVGFAYIVGTLASSVMYLMVLEGKMSNDFWWQGFNSTGGHRFLASLLTSQYKTGDMDLTALPIYGAFNTTNDAVDFSLPHSMNIHSTSIDQLEWRRYDFRGGSPLCFAVSTDPGFLCPLAGIVSPCQSNPLQEPYHMSRNEGILAIVMTRYVEDLDTGALDLVTANIVAMGPFSFYTWHFLYHWTKGYRDVLSFEGDVATITVRMAVLYVVSHRGRVEAWNLLKLNHVEGDCPMLTLRAISAICLLSTSQLALAQSDHGGYFTKFDPCCPKSKGDLQTIIVSAEVCWHTLWTATALLQLTVPLTVQTKLVRACSWRDLDVKCTYGVVEIGSLFEHPHVPVPRLQSLVLYSLAGYTFSFDEWTVGGVVYVDKSSAFLNGLVVVGFGPTLLYVLDVKTWRSYAIPKPNPQYVRWDPRLVNCVPLVSQYS